MGGSSYSVSGGQANILCGQCGRKSTRQRSNSAKNPGRDYYTCPGCDLWLIWEDEIPGDYSRRGKLERWFVKGKEVSAPGTGGFINGRGENHGKKLDALFSLVMVVLLMNVVMVLLLMVMLLKI